MDLQNFGTKELYDVVLKANKPMTLGNKNYQMGEIVIAFDNLTISHITEQKSHYQAHGGYDDRALVTWDYTKAVGFLCTQGVFSKKQLAIMTNAKIVDSNNLSILITKKEELESDENGIIHLKYIPYNGIFIYNAITGEQIEFNQNENIVTIPNPFMEVVIYYNYVYNKKSTLIKIGNSLTNDTFELEGKIRLKDSLTGKNITALLFIPNLKIMSDLNFTMGQEANPVIANFQAVGYPIGGKGQESTCELLFLNEDIDNEQD